MVQILNLIFALLCLWIFHHSNNPVTHGLFFGVGLTLLSFAFIAPQLDMAAIIWLAFLWSLVAGKVIRIQLRRKAHNH